MPLPMRPPGEPPKRPTPAETPEEALPSEDSLGLPAIDFSSFGSGEQVASNTAPAQEAPALPELDYSADEALPDFSSQEISSGLPELSFDSNATEAISEDELDDLFADAESAEADTEILNEDDWDSFDDDETGAPSPLNESPLSNPFDEDEFPATSESALPEQELEGWDSFDDDEPAQPEVIDDAFLNDLFSDDNEDEVTPDSPAVAGSSENTWDDDFDSFMEDLDNEDAPDSENEENSADEDETQELEQDDSDEVPAPLSRGRRSSGRRSSGGARTNREARPANPIVKALSGIPLLGLLFRPLLKLGNLGAAILGLLPLILIPIVIYFIASGTVPGGNSITGPDGGQASISNFGYEDGAITALITNGGDTVANVTSELNVWSYDPFGGGSIFSFDKVANCEAEEVAVEIDSESSVTVPCEAPTSGLITRYSGTISF